MPKTTPFLLFFTLLPALPPARSEPYLGVNYGELADNLPPPASTALLLQSTVFSNLRLYNADPAVISSFSGTGISLLLGVPNSDIPSLAGDPSASASWLSTNLLPFIPSTNISAVSVGNEVLNSGDPSLSSLLLPAMQNLRAAIAATPSAAAVKISTVHSMAVLSQSDPPSAGNFHSDLAGILQPILQFLSDNNSPFMINPYPYFAYKSDPRPETLAYCLFQPGPARPDTGSGISYSNMFDAQVDAVRAALRAAGFAGQEVVVAETGWPYKGDDNEVGASIENARAYNGNLIAHLRSMADPVTTYLFAMYDEDLKPGPTTERSFGLFGPDLRPIYDAGMLKSGQDLGGSPSQVAPAESSRPEEVCVAGEGGGGGVCRRPGVEFLPSAAMGRGDWKEISLLLGLVTFLGVVLIA
ncbi:glucan endo-1,3-beta-glucosidase 7-like [Phalaenopsis equestris]|uniref:glucan endo-1,3-beta-glucosidase 7-like n=1 Tax=Phalaenopsis equestris TaxID=78828 RepID=UPI0009E400C1|nr:glucan endo-1,3-beta-glucosidase 7-like [Phalaenopsis equestris]